MKKYQSLLLQKYLKEGLSTSELDLFFKHLEHLDPKEAEEICRERWMMESDVLEEQTRVSIREGVLSKLDSTTKFLDSGRARRVNWYRPALKIAASLVILLSVLTWLFHGDLKSTDLIEVVTASGQQLEYTLPDATVVTLNENSTLSYSADLSSNDVREIYLEGEAYFEVEKEHQRQRHFKVITPGLSVDVLGTIFNVNTSNASTEVYLEEGSVRLTVDVADEDRQILMQPGDLVKYSTVEKRVLEHVNDQREHVGRWKDDILFFSKVSMSEVLEALSIQYSLQVDIRSKSVLDRTIIAGIPKNNLDQAIKTMEKILGVDLVLQENVLRIN